MPKSRVFVQMSNFGAGFLSISAVRGIVGKTGTFFDKLRRWLFRLPGYRESGPDIVLSRQFFSFLYM